MNNILSILFWSVQTIKQNSNLITDIWCLVRNVKDIRFSYYNRISNVSTTKITKEVQHYNSERYIHELIDLIFVLKEYWWINFIYIETEKERCHLAVRKFLGSSMWHTKGSILRLRPAFEVDETCTRDDASFSHASAPSRPLAPIFALINIFKSNLKFTCESSSSYECFGLSHNIY